MAMKIFNVQADFREMFPLTNAPRMTINFCRTIYFFDSETGTALIVPRTGKTQGTTRAMHMFLNHIFTKIYRLAVRNWNKPHAR